MTKPNLEEFKAALRLTVPGVAIHVYPDMAANADTPSANILFTGAPGSMIGVYFYDTNVSLDAVRAVFNAYGIDRAVIQENSTLVSHMFISLSCFEETS